MPVKTYDIATTSKEDRYPIIFFDPPEHERLRHLIRANYELTKVGKQRIHKLTSSEFSTDGKLIVKEVKSILSRYLPEMKVINRNENLDNRYFAFGKSKSRVIYGSVEKNGSIAEMGLYSSKDYYDQDKKLSDCYQETESVFEAIRELCTLSPAFICHNNELIVDMTDEEQVLFHLVPIKFNTDLEKRISQDPDWIAGVLWGERRFGHPEGRVIYHIHETLRNVNKLDLDNTILEKLRLICFIHDTFKGSVDNSKPRIGSNHHARIAGRFAEKYISDKSLVSLIDHHDDAFHAWIWGYRKKRWDKAEEYLDRLFKALDNEVELFYYFYVCDNNTGDKIQDPLHWFESRISDKIDLISLTDQNLDPNS